MDTKSITKAKALVAATLAAAALTACAPRPTPCATSAAYSERICYPITEHGPDQVANMRAHGHTVDYREDGWWYVDGIATAHTEAEDADVVLCVEEEG